jgi:hypothetical protein
MILLLGSRSSLYLQCLPNLFSNKTWGEPLEYPVNTNVVFHMAAETAIAMSTHRHQIFASACSFAEVLVWRVVPDLTQAAPFEVTHGEVTGIAGKYSTIYFNAGMKPRNVAWQFLPYGFTYLIDTKVFPDQERGLRRPISPSWF